MHSLTGVLPVKTHWAVWAIAGSLLLTISAKFQVPVPFLQVPMTMQTAVVFLLGIAFGPVAGVSAVLLYLFQGALGFPVFAETPQKGIGLAYMMGPTGGYLIGFVVAAWVCGVAGAKNLSGLKLAAAVTLATAAIYLCGVPYLASLIGFEKAIQFGLLPFLLTDLIKIVLVVLITEAGLKKLRPFFGQSS